MITTVAVAEERGSRAGVLVRSGTSLFIYWDLTGDPVTCLKVVDLSGHGPPDLLDGFGSRLIPVRREQRSSYVADLLPGRIYGIQIGRLESGGFSARISLRPVQTPWSRLMDGSEFPSPYHRS